MTGCSVLASACNAWAPTRGHLQHSTLHVRPASEAMLHKSAPPDVVDMCQERVAKSDASRQQSITSLTSSTTTHANKLAEHTAHSDQGIAHRMFCLLTMTPDSTTSHTAPHSLSTAQVAYPSSKLCMRRPHPPERRRKLSLSDASFSEAAPSSQQGTQ